MHVYKHLAFKELIYIGYYCSISKHYGLPISYRAEFINFTGLSKAIPSLVREISVGELTKHRYSTTGSCLNPLHHHLPSCAPTSSSLTVRAGERVCVRSANVPFLALTSPHVNISLETTSTCIFNTCTRTVVSYPDLLTAAADAWITSPLRSGGTV